MAHFLSNLREPRGSEFFNFYCVCGRAIDELKMIPLARVEVTVSKTAAKVNALFYRGHPEVPTLVMGREEGVSRALRDEFLFLPVTHPHGHYNGPKGAMNKYLERTEEGPRFRQVKNLTFSAENLESIPENQRESLQNFIRNKIQPFFPSVRPEKFQGLSIQEAKQP